MERNTYCLLCTECIKACPYENIALRPRPFMADLALQKGRKLDEAFKSFIMLGSAVMYSIVMLGPWGTIKDWANLSSGWSFALYAGIFLGALFVAGPTLHLLFGWVARTAARAREVPIKKVFVEYAYALVPIGLMGWIAFSFSFVLPNISYAVSALSDPFGWGWNLFGTRGYPWTPYYPGLLPYIQVPVLLVGLAASVRVGHTISWQVFGGNARARRALVPLAGYLLAITALFLGLYLG
jgi:ferredoxin